MQFTTNMCILVLRVLKDGAGKGGSVARLVAPACGTILCCVAGKRGFGCAPEVAVPHRGHRIPMLPLLVYQSKSSSLTTTTYSTPGSFRSAHIRW